MEQADTALVIVNNLAKLSVLVSAAGEMTPFNPWRPRSRASSPAALWSVTQRQ